MSHDVCKSRRVVAYRLSRLLVRPYVARHFRGVCPGVLSERPTDGLADEEVAVGQVRFDVGVKKVEVGVLLELELADDRDPTLPKDGRPCSTRARRGRIRSGCDRSSRPTSIASSSTRSHQAPAVIVLAHGARRNRARTGSPSSTVTIQVEPFS